MSDEQQKGQQDVVAIRKKAEEIAYRYGIAGVEYFLVQEIMTLVLTTCEQRKRDGASDMGTRGFTRNRFLVKAKNLREMRVRRAAVKSVEYRAPL